MHRRPAHRLTRAERLRLTAAALRGAVTGVVSAIATWLISHLIP